MEIPPVSKYLASINTPHQVFEHTHPIKSLESAAEERNLLPDQLVRSILFRIEASRYIMICVSGPKQIDWKSLRKHLGVSRISMATPGEVLELTGYKIGTVGPFGLKEDFPILLDKNILSHDEISFGSGRTQSAIIMNTREFINSLDNYKVIDFIK